MATVVTIKKLTDTDEWVYAEVISNNKQGLRFMVPKYVTEWLQKVGAFDEEPNYPIYND